MVFEPAATEQQVKSLEAVLGLSLPPSFRRALRGIAAHVEFRWFLPKDFELPETFRKRSQVALIDWDRAVDFVVTRWSDDSQIFPISRRALSTNLTPAAQRSTPELVAAACQVGGLGGVARQFDGFLVRRARLLTAA